MRSSSPAARWHLAGAAPAARRNRRASFRGHPMSTSSSALPTEGPPVRPGWCVLDCRHDLMDIELGRRQYAQGHVPGALFAGIDDDCRAKTGANAASAAGPGAACSEIRRLGYRRRHADRRLRRLRRAVRVRLWWLARWLGHAKVALLDGGCRRGSPRRPSRPSGERAPRRFAPATAWKARVGARTAAAARRRSALLVDARAPSATRAGGADRPVAGHIPGA